MSILQIFSQNACLEHMQKMQKLINNFNRTCRVFTRLFTLNTPWHFLDFALYILWLKLRLSNKLIYFPS